METQLVLLLYVYLAGILVFTIATMEHATMRELAAVAVLVLLWPFVVLVRLVDRLEGSIRVRRRI